MDALTAANVYIQDVAHNAVRRAIIDNKTSASIRTQDSAQHKARI